MTDKICVVKILQDFADKKLWGGGGQWCPGSFIPFITFARYFWKRVKITSTAKM